jgi:hypothetical protein
VDGTFIRPINENSRITKNKNKNKNKKKKKKNEDSLLVHVLSNILTVYISQQQLATDTCMCHILY